MKKYFLRIIAALILASAVLPGCSVEYRERHRHIDHDNDGHRDDHHYRNY